MYLIISYYKTIDDHMIQSEQFNLLKAINLGSV